MPPSNSTTTPSSPYPYGQEEEEKDGLLSSGLHPGGANYCLAAACHSLGFDLAEVWHQHNGSGGNDNEKEEEKEKAPFTLVKSWEKWQTQHLAAPAPFRMTRSQSIKVSS